MEGLPLLVTGPHYFVEQGGVGTCIFVFEHKIPHRVDLGKHDLETQTLQQLKEFPVSFHSTIDTWCIRRTPFAVISWICEVFKIISIRLW